MLPVFYAENGERNGYTMNGFWKRPVYSVSISVLVLILGLGIYGEKVWSLPAEHPSIKLATEATLYALPLVIMDLTREETFANSVAADAMPNRFFHKPILGNASYSAVVRPNVDTLYSTAWLDLTTEPVLMTVPPSNGRYFMIQCMDAWTNVFADPGIRTLGNKGTRYAIVGPNWLGRLPKGVKVIHAPTRMVRVLGRVYVRNQADLPAARAYQKQLDIRPLSRLNDTSFKSAYPRLDDKDVESPIMIDILQRLGPQSFFERFMKLTVANPPGPQDTQFIKNVLEPLGLTPDKPIAWESINNLNQHTLTVGFEQVMNVLKNRESLEQHHRSTLNGWSGVTDIDNFPNGNYGTNYRFRAGVAVFGLGANLREDANYLNASVDQNGNRLDGSKRYYLKFNAGETPPVWGFWSITLYDDKGHLVANSFDRYAIKSGEDLVHEPDGSLVIFLQPNDPGPEHRANWLPSPSGQKFELSLRAYWPKKELLEGRWKPPAVIPAE